jgi:MFS family permease
LEHSSEKDGETEKHGPSLSLRKSFVPSLVLLSFAASIAGPILTLLSRDIARTFFPSSFAAGASQEAQTAAVGWVTQLNTVNLVAEVAVALLMGVLIIRFKNKPLILTGALLILVSAVGNSVASTLFWLQVFYALEGIGSVVAGVALVTLVGDILPSNRKAKAISYIVAAVFLASIVGFLVIPPLRGVGGWRYAFLFFGLPVSVVGLVLAFFSVPSVPQMQRSTTGTGIYKESFRKVLVNKSAASCLFSRFFFVGASIAFFTIPYFQQQFSLSVGNSAYVAIAALLVYAASSVVTGRLIGKCGSKTLATVGVLLDGFLIMGIFLAPNLWSSLAFNLSHCWFSGMAISSFACLVLDQIPDARGTMMSLTRVFTTAGDATSAAVGGFMLIFFLSYPIMGLALGAMSVAAGAIVFFLVKQPTI